MTDSELDAELLKQFDAAPIPEFLALARRVLRSDLEANKRYRRADPLPLGCPIVALGWTDDDEVPAHLMGGWVAYGQTTYRMLRGAHYDYLNAPPELRQAIREGISMGTGSYSTTPGSEGGIA
jgi:surfactin synthase thioesterase subunit